MMILAIEKTRDKGLACFHDRLKVSVYHLYPDKYHAQSLDEAENPSLVSYL